MKHSKSSGSIRQMQISAPLPASPSPSPSLSSSSSNPYRDIGVGRPPKGRSKGAKSGQEEHEVSSSLQFNENKALGHRRGRGSNHFRIVLPKLCGTVPRRLPSPFWARQKVWSETSLCLFRFPPRLCQRCALPHPPHLPAAPQARIAHLPKSLCSFELGSVHRARILSSILFPSYIPLSPALGIHITCASDQPFLGEPVTYNLWISGGQYGKQSGTPLECKREDTAFSSLSLLGSSHPLHHASQRPLSFNHAHAHSEHKP